MSTESEKPKNTVAGTDKKAATNDGNSNSAVNRPPEDKPAVEQPATTETKGAIGHQASTSSPGSSSLGGSSIGSSTAPAGPARVEQKSGSSGGGSWLSGMALLLALAALAGTAYQWWMQQNVVEEEVQEEPWRDQLSQLGQQSGELKTQLESGLGALEDQLGATRSQLQAVQQETTSDIRELSAVNEDLLKQLAKLGSADRDDWKLAEVEYLLRLAHQRVVMGGELSSAASLLANADNALVELNMAGLHQVRKQVARDLAAVRAAQQLDSEGVYLRLEALQQQSSDLPFFGMPEISESDVQSGESAGDLFDLAAQDWQAALDKGWDQAVEKFKTLVVVQKRDGAIEPLLSEAWQRLVRERLALDLEQAKNALVLQQQTIYREALGNAAELVQSHYLTDDPATRSVLQELKSLQQEKIVAQLPDVSGSQEAIRAYIDRKYQSRESAAPAAEDASDDSAPATSSDDGYDWQQMGTD